MMQEPHKDLYYSLEINSEPVHLFKKKNNSFLKFRFNSVLKSLIAQFMYEAPNHMLVFPK